MRRINCLLLLLVLLCFSCNRSSSSKAIVVDPGFSNYVSAFTSGVISSNSEIKILLTKPVEGVKPNEIVTKGLLTFSPSIEGQAIWVDAQTIVFTPSEPLTSGENYQGNFKLSKVLDVPSAFSELKFSFAIISQSLFVRIDGLQIPNVDQSEIQELIGSVRTNDRSPSNALENCVKATLENDALPIQWVHSEDQRIHKFRIAGIERIEKEQFLTIEWNGEAIGSKSKGKEEVRIPPLGEFTFQKINVQRLPQLHFEVYFSDPIATDQSLDGLVYLQSGKPLRLEVSDNVIKAFPKRSLSKDETVHIHQSIKNSDGNQLQESHVEKISFSLSKPAVERVDEGVIMPSDGNALFPFRAINLKAVNLRIVRVFEDNVPQFLQSNKINEADELSRVGRMVYDGYVDLISPEPIDYGEWNTFAIDLHKYIDQEPGAIYRVMIGFERYQSLYPCGDSLNEMKPLTRHVPNEDDGRYFYNNWNWYEGHYDWNERENPCSDSYFLYHQRGIQANLISSSLGLIAKQSEGDLFDVVVTDLSSTKPLSGVLIEAFSYQHRSLGSATSNSDGIARVHSDERPYLVVASLGKEKGYLRVDAATALSTSLFETGGNKVKKGVKGFIYGERGVWRPGDTLHLSFMLEDLQNVLPPSHPVIIELKDPQGRLIHRRVSTEGLNGLYTWHLPTSAKDPTGLWRATVKVGASQFSKSLRIETIKPNRILVNYELPKVIRSGETTSGELEAKWLYGSPAGGLKANVEMELLRMKTSFDSYEGYSFDDLSKRYYPAEPIIVESVTDSEGKSDIRLDFDEPRNAPGMLQMRLATKIYEAGGDFSQDFMNRKYSPYSSYVGMKMEGGENWSKAINTEEEHTMMVAAVDPEGKGVDRNIKLEIHRISWSWWWESDGYNRNNYVNMRNSTLLGTQTFKVEKGKRSIQFKLDKPTWGRLLIKVTDLESGHSASKVIFAEYPNWADQEAEVPEAASMLSMETDKEYYSVGDEAEVRIPSGAQGRMWVTIEKGDRILQQFWINAEKGKKKFQFQVTEEMTPNIYVSAMLIQPHGQQENSLPIRLFGIIPIAVEAPNTRITPLIKAPEEVRPESTFSCTVKEKDGKPMTYTLAVVDEGLLSLTRFKTPDPWKSFYQKEALGVRSWDLYKYVMNTSTAGLTPLLATGGDESLDFKDLQEVNRFKPVVSFLGPFELSPNETGKHEVTLPNYIGAVRVMVVAGEDGAYGNASEEVLVKQPLMVLSTMPRVLGPSEEVVVPVQVMAMQDNLKDVVVKVETNDLLQLQGSSSQKVSFSKAGEKMVYFRFQVARKLGKAEFKVTVKGKGYSAKEELEIAVRAPNPSISTSEYAIVDAGQSWQTRFDLPGLKGTNSGQLSVSNIPDMGIEKQLNYLIRYPHGCIEQTTSSAFPQLFLEKFVELDDEDLVRIQDNVRAGLNKLRSFQTSYGGFGYWPGDEDPSLWGTNYAGHFMLEAEKAGYDLPPGILPQWLRFQKDEASRWTRRDAVVHRYTGSDLIQAYRLYTLALAGKADLGAMNRLKSDSQLSVKAAWRLAAAYAIIGKNDAAQQLTASTFPTEPYREMSYTYGSNVRDLAMAIETKALTKDLQGAAPMMKELAKELNNGWHSTQTRAYALIAFSKVLGDASSQSPFSFRYILDGKEEKVNCNKAIFLLDIDESQLNSEKIQLSNRSDKPLFVQLQQTGIPLEDGVETEAKDLNLSIKYVDMKGRAIDISKLEQGTDFKAIVTVKHPGIRSEYEEIALSQLFPSGWQIINKRISGSGESNPDIEYQDIRDDRVYSYFDLKKNQEIKVVVNLNSTFAGKYYLPAVYCSAMYDESVYAVEKGMWVEVLPGSTDVN